MSGEGTRSRTVTQEHDQDCGRIRTHIARRPTSVPGITEQRRIRDGCWEQRTLLPPPTRMSFEFGSHTRARTLRPQRSWP
eukprot:3662720-Rhodomonas_salina.2